MTKLIELCKNKGTTLEQVQEDLLVNKDNLDYINAKDNNGQTPVDIVSIERDMGIVELLNHYINKIINDTEYKLVKE